LFWIFDWKESRCGQHHKGVCDGIVVVGNGMNEKKKGFS